MSWKFSLSDIKKIMEYSDDWRDVVKAALDDGDGSDFANVRVIHSDVIDDILADEIASDEYVLGAFNASFIADVMDWPVELVEAAQGADAYSAIGRAIVNTDKVSDMARAYAAADGYGHHFSSWDGSETELSNGWYLFRM